MDMCQKHHLDVPPGFKCPKCASRDGGIILVTIALVIVFLAGTCLRAADVPKPADPTPDQRVALFKMYGQAVGLERDVTQLIADIGLDKLKKLNELQEKKTKAEEAYQKSFKELQEKSHCSLDEDFKCFTVSTAETAKK